MRDLDSEQKGKLIKEALLLIDKLSKINIENDKDDLEDIIEKAVKITKNKHWKLY
jgi:hypothetical protein